MSKASQRRLADQQKRRQKAGGLHKGEAKQILEMLGDVIQNDDPMTYWMLRRKTLPADPTPADYEFLTQMVFPLIQPLIDGLADAAGALDGSDDRWVSGVLFNIANDDSYSSNHLPLDLTTIETPLDEGGPGKWLFDHLTTAPAKVRAAAWAFSITSPGYPIALWIASRSGGCVCTLLVGNRWLDVPFCMLNAEVEQSRQELRANSRVGKCLKELEELNLTHSNQLVMKTCQQSAQPYLRLALDCACRIDELIEDIEELEWEAKEALEESQRRSSEEVEHAIEQGEKEAQRTRQVLAQAQAQNAALSAQLASAKRANVSPSDPPKQAQVDFPSSSLGERLTAFFA